MLYLTCDKIGTLRLFKRKPQRFLESDGFLSDCWGFPGYNIQDPKEGITVCKPWDKDKYHDISWIIEGVELPTWEDNPKPIFINDYSLIYNPDSRFTQDFDKTAKLIEAEWNKTYGKVSRSENHLELVTGGWSDNETIVSEIDRSIFGKLYWQKSERGGLYVFGRDEK